MSEDRVEITRRRGREGSVFELSGNIGEHFDASLVLAEKGLVVLDMDGVHRITSFGVREWVNTLGAGESQGLYYTKCRPMIVTQFNMVVGFEAGGTLLSFYLPYVCEQCDHETEVLLDLCVDWQVIEDGKLPDVICPSCGAEPEFDEMPSSYFSYASMKGRPQISPALRGLLDGSQEETPFVLQKEVVGSVTALWLSGSMEGGARLKRAVDGVEGIVVLDFGGVTKLADKPLTQMASALASSGSDFYFARVPTSGLSALPRPVVDVMKGRVASARLPWRCPACERRHEDHVTITLGELHREAPQRRRPCPQCGEVVVPLLDLVVAASASPLLLQEVPEELEEYLAERPSGPPLSVVAEPTTKGSIATSPGPRYETIRLLGVGGMAEVYVAKQSGVASFEKRVVLKRILPSLARDPSFVEMFLQEARTAAQISHANVVQINDLGYDGQHYFIAMEYVRGWDLRALLNACASLGRPVPVDVACHILSDVCAGLSAAHHCVLDSGEVIRIVHRDVSPHNILVSRAGVGKLTDFGVSKVYRGTEVGTQSGMLKGKVLYMAPEQIDPTRGVTDHRADIFAAGVVLYEVLSGASPFKRETEFMTLSAVLRDDLPSIRSVRSDVPPEIERVLFDALERDPDKRLSTISKMKERLDRAIAGSESPSPAARVAAWVAELGDAAGAELAPDNFTPTGSREIKRVELETQIIRGDTDASSRSRARASATEIGAVDDTVRPEGRDKD